VAYLFIFPSIFSEILINLYINKNDMRKLLAIIMALINGGASIDFVDKSPISRTPGDVTELSHN
jgi:hypothetical protein